MNANNSSVDSVVSTQTAAHFFWGERCEGWWLKRGGRFTVIAETMPAGTSETKHFHQETEQFFYVLEGVLSMELDDKTYHLQKNEGMSIAAGIAHKAFNASNQAVSFLVISCPDSHEDRVNLS